MKSTTLMKLMILSISVIIAGFTSSQAQCSSSKKSHRTSNNVHRTSYQSQQSYSKPSSTKGRKNIVELAVSSHSLSTLVAAVKAAGLVETLSGKGPFTVFAPTNTAFEALPEGTLESLLKPENKETLIKILTYHVVPGRIEANDLSTGKVASVEGSKIAVDVNSGAVKINDALVTDANNRALNGVVHVIDRVILPPGM